MTADDVTRDRSARPMLTHQRSYSIRRARLVLGWVTYSETSALYRQLKPLHRKHYDTLATVVQDIKPFSEVAVRPSVCCMPLAQKRFTL